MPRRLLVVVTTEVANDELRKFVRSRAGEDAEIRVVAPASDISRLDWLTNAEDDARSEAASLAAKTAEATPTDDVEARVGDSDPVRAIEDPLRTFVETAQTLSGSRTFAYPARRSRCDGRATERLVARPYARDER